MLRESVGIGHLVGPCQDPLCTPMALHRMPLGQSDKRSNHPYYCKEHRLVDCKPELWYRMSKASGPAEPLATMSQIKAPHGEVGPLHPYDSAGPCESCGRGGAGCTLRAALLPQKLWSRGDSLPYPHGSQNGSSGRRSCAGNSLRVEAPVYGAAPPAAGGSE